MFVCADFGGLPTAKVVPAIGTQPKWYKIENMILKIHWGPRILASLRLAKAKNCPFYPFLGGQPEGFHMLPELWQHHPEDVTLVKPQEQEAPFNSPHVAAQHRH